MVNGGIVVVACGKVSRGVCAGLLVRACSECESVYSCVCTCASQLTLFLVHLDFIYVLCVRLFIYTRRQDTYPLGLRAQEDIPAAVP